MNNVPLKGILVGSAISITLGFISYLVVAFISIYALDLQQGGATPEALAAVKELMHSKTAYLLSFPATFILLGIAGYHAAKRSSPTPYFAAIAVALITCFAINYGFNMLTIYRNYIPIILGALAGCYLWVREQKLNQALKQGSA